MVTKSLRLLPILLALWLPGTVLAVTGDADNDGLRDAVETGTGIYVSPNDTGTNPNLADSDGDGVPDAVEINQGTNPNDPTSKIQRPNIILINCDDLGYGDVGCFWQNQRTGTQKFATPGLDALAADGVMLTQHYVGAPVCASSRASLLQGRHQGHSDIRNSQFDYALPNNHSIASVLHAAGYHTVHVGKAGLTGAISSNATTTAGLAAHPRYRGFDRFFGYWSHGQAHEHYPQNATTANAAYITDDFQMVKNAYVDLYTTDAWTAFAKKTIIEDTQNTPNRPFFLYLAYDTPHFRNQVPPTRDYPTGKGLTGGIQWTGAPSYASTATNDPTKIDNIANQHSSVDPTWPDIQRRQVSMIRRIDDCVSDIIQTLRDLHIDNNTLIIFTSDNGPAYEDGQDPRFFKSYANFEGIKRDIWEGGMRVPTIAWWPGHIPEATNLPTSAAARCHRDTGTGSPPSPKWPECPPHRYTDGISLLPTLTASGTHRQREYLYFEFNNPGGATAGPPSFPDFPHHGNELQNQSQAIRIGDFMGVRVNIATAANAFRIYNVVTDPSQGTDLSGTRNDLAIRMMQIAVTARRPLAAVSRPYDTTPMPAISPGPVTNGLLYKSYEGYWPWVPEFRVMTETASGMTPLPDVGVRSRDKDVGISFTGYVSVPTTGTYNFSVNSDSGSSLWIHDAHVIDNDFNYTANKTSAPVYLEAGLHPVRLYYRHQGANPVLQLDYSGPGIPLQQIPASAYFTDGTPADLSPSADAFITPKNTPILVDALANDTGIYSFSLASVGSPRHGTACISSGMIQYVPASGFIGSDTFSYSVAGGAATASANIHGDILYNNEIWIPFDEGSGTFIRSVSPTSSITGSLKGASVAGNPRIVGKFDYALTFNGSDDQVDFPGLNLPLGSAPRTFCCWMRTGVKTATELQTIFSYGANNNGNRFSVRLNNLQGVSADQAIRLEVQSGRAVGTKILNDGLWHHIVVVVDDVNKDGVVNVAETQFYVDGAADPVSNSAAFPINTVSGPTPCMGASNHATNYNFKGDIDDIRIFPYALTATDVGNLYATTVVSPTVDSDGDGALDTDELIAGTDPYNPTSVFKVSATTQSSSAITLHWQSVQGKTYSVEESADMSSWAPVPGISSFVAPSNNPDASVDIPSNSSPKRFFRLSVH